ncbi:mitochondrial 54S ribosomal protein YmL2 [Saccharomycopsis crataegensis]|uniref:Large ribosomal subunit protein bL27m n=1 Tax=Saccharomycopsis crataegensis TaxID=43959 RepID=A0AAV5QPP1_9ASCO|nr:mitochondrial 54S ribosomal protein YmL2 [Saccharomycopsis crataegensis]
MSSIFSLSKASSLTKKVLVAGKLLAQNNNAFNSNIPSSSLLALSSIQIRTSTKKAAGSKTNMKDSAGRRLGPKKNEGILVRTGQIIYRQRGTKIHPGENTGIGRDHTIYAKEPGYVRYYLDPFHPSRKFVGVALRKDLALPSNHWEPRVRRFGYVELKDSKSAQQEEEHLTRKDWLLKQKVDKEVEQRDIRRQTKKQELLTEFKALNIGEFSEDQLNIVASRLLNVQRFLINGFSLSESEQNVTFNDLYDYKLSLKRTEIDEAKYQELVSQYKSLASKTDEHVAFNAKYHVVKKISEEKKKAMKTELIGQLTKLTEQLPIKKDDKSKIVELITNAENTGVLTKSEIVRVRRRFLKPVAPESVAVLEKSAKKSVSYKRFDYSSNKVVTIIRSNDAFLSKAK